MFDSCPFCNFKNSIRATFLFDNEFCFCVELHDPVLVGSCMIIPKAHKVTVFDLCPKEWEATKCLVDRVKEYVDAKYKPDGYSVGWNCGETGGQTVFHAHLHIIPRYADEPCAGRGIRGWIKREENRRPSLGMFCDIKNELDNPIVRKLVSESASDQSEEAMDRRAAEFKRRGDMHLYGWLEGGEILGVCGVEVCLDCVVINNIAVDPSARNRGIGKAMMAAVQRKYKTTIKAETDDDAVEFYVKCGFDVEGFIKTYGGVGYQRYSCVLRY